MNGPFSAAVTSLYLELEAAAELSPFISMIPFVPSFFVSGFRGNAICIGFWKYTYLIYLPTRLLLSISHKPLPKPPSSLKAARRLIDYNKLHEKKSMILTGVDETCTRDFLQIGLLESAQ